MVFVARFIAVGRSVVIAAALFGCQPDYSPNTYSGEAVQQANKVEPGVVIGFRQVEIRANGTVGTVTGAAAGGVLGSQPDITGIPAALGALGGSVVGGIVGSTIEHTTGDTTGWEYIVRQTNGDMVSVTQKQKIPIPLGQKVLVITGKQARIVPDYATATNPPPDAASSKAESDKKETVPVAAPSEPATPPADAPAPSTAASTPDDSASPSSNSEPPQ
jgi:outer membrane lipoprotein SlyB